MQTAVLTRSGQNLSWRSKRRGSRKTEYSGNSTLTPAGMRAPLLSGIPPAGAVRGSPLGTGGFMRSVSEMHASRYGARPARTSGSAAAASARRSASCTRGESAR